jgi:hypothetical protein
MAGNIRGHIAGLLRTSKRHSRYVGVLALLAVVVALGVTMGLRRNGRAATVEQTVLDCHAAAGVAHTHNADCYVGGDLVCPLQERELHVHDDSCYDEAGNLTCGKEEAAEEHVHGAGCFKTVTVRNSDGEIIEVDEDRANIEGMELMEEPEEEVEVQGEPAGEVDEGSLEASAVDDEATDVAPTSDTTTSTEEEDTDSGESTSDEDSATSDDTTKQDASEDASGYDGRIWNFAVDLCTDTGFFLAVGPYLFFWKNVQSGDHQTDQ